MLFLMSRLLFNASELRTVISVGSLNMARHLLFKLWILPFPFESISKLTDSSSIYTNTWLHLHNYLYLCLGTESFRALLVAKMGSNYNSIIKTPSSFPKLCNHWCTLRKQNCTLFGKSAVFYSWAIFIESNFPSTDICLRQCSVELFTFLFGILMKPLHQ